MFRRSVTPAFCAILLIAGVAAADVGTIQSFSATPLPPAIGPDIDLLVTATTSGASTPVPSDSMYIFASMYYPTPYLAHTTSVFYGTNALRTGTSNVFDHTFSFTLPRGGQWGYYAFVFNYAYSTTSYLYGSIVLGEFAPIPTMTLPGLAILGALLAGIGIFILRRA